MNLTGSVSHFFSEGSKRLGQSLHTARAVHVERGGTESVEAIVNDDAPRLVTLSLDRHYIRYSCTCPRRARECEHVWATLLEAERMGLLADRPQSRYLAMWNRVQHDSGGLLSRMRGGRGATSRAEPLPEARWKLALAHLRSTTDPSTLAEALPPGRELLYVVDVPRSVDAAGIVIEPCYRERRRSGQWTRPKRVKLSAEQLAGLPDPLDRQAFGLLVGAQRYDQPAWGWPSRATEAGGTSPQYLLTRANQQVVLAALCATGRCLLRRSRDNSEVRRLTWSNPPWELCLEVTPGGEGAAGRNYQVAATLRRGDESLPIASADLLLPGGIAIARGEAAPLLDSQAFEWAELFRKEGTLQVPMEAGPELLSQLYRSARLPKIHLPPELAVEEVAVAPQPRLAIAAGDQGDRTMYGSPSLRGTLAFDYGGQIIAASETPAAFFDQGARRITRRDLSAESQYAARLVALGFRREEYRYSGGSGQVAAGPSWRLNPKRLPQVVRALTAEGWHIEAEGKVYRQAGAVRMEVKSGIDWFELHGDVSFGEQSAALPALLAAIRRGENLVQLDDGTCGIIPEDWLKRWGLLASTGEAEGEHLKFRSTQLVLLDALVAAQPQASWDDNFARARGQLAAFAGIAAIEADPAFIGTLRPYQRDGLGWLMFLRSFGFGGCLADDMGLGKTIQVLALLQRLRREQPKMAPALIVVPRSLIFNWRQESARFTPKLRILDHTGTERLPAGEHFSDYDIILTTYGTMLRDIALLSQVRFEYVILDEAQAIKNSASETARAARLLQASHRLALSGTPIQNHLGELWSLFEFLNPGMLGASSAFRDWTAPPADGDGDDARPMLATALRPFILRRTKEQVASDLPARLEQTIFCELDGRQRSDYDELREHYRRSLLAKVDRDGMNASRMHVLEALLRLRQAACHPGLIDPARAADPSAKLDSLLAQLDEVIDEGHKALVFSQFVTFLSIVRSRLDALHVPYEYLDGQTRDREERVGRFQSDPACKLFLISLKAGGLGLNLTAADYVFLLDPWWNPAVEAQAIDRAHRIGQSRQVFAYRLIAKGTVEEKVLALQQTKRDLADAIISADNSLIGKLGREDLELLLA